MTEQPKEEYTITIRIKLPQGMDEKRAEEYIKQFLKPNGWGAWFASNYIHVVDFVFSRPAPPLTDPLRCWTGCPCSTPECEAHCVEKATEEQHDAAIRNKTLDEVKEIVDTYYQAVPKLRCIELCQMTKDINSLRTTNPREQHP